MAHAVSPPPHHPRLQNLVVAVHGIGDQTRNGTILSTIIRFCDHFKYPGTVALGAFHDALTQADPKLPPTPALTVEPPPDCAGLTGAIGFAEVHWADVARDIAEDKYYLQETKEWARSVVNRVRVMAAASGTQMPGGIDYARIRRVLEEMIDVIGVFEALLFLARKAGIAEFDLKHMLDAFLGDVQIVAEFAGFRRRIVDRLHATLRCAHLSQPEAKIHLVAHSEGTVVAWLGLLEALGDPARYPWINSVRGFMTLGSPIDKHLILWPELFRDFTGPAFRRAPGQPRIRWVNYVDYGDPVGFELDTARAWMRARGYDQVFQFRPKDDLVFGRYYFPGKAHNDYWKDPAVFSHFITNVVLPPSTRGPAVPPPASKWWARASCYAVAYVLPLGVLWVAAYVLYQGLVQHLYPETASAPNPAPGVMRALSLCVGLLAATTLWLRLEELTRAWRWRILGGVIYAATAAVFWWMLHDSADEDLPAVAWLNAIPRILRPEIGVAEGLIAASLVLIVITQGIRRIGRGLKQLFSFNAGALGFAQGGARPAPPADSNSAPQTATAATLPATSRLKTMIALGALALAATIGLNALGVAPGEHGSLWPLILASAGFLYLWRLATHIFDLGFVWHRYIRHGVSLAYLRDAKYGHQRVREEHARDLAADNEPDDPRDDDVSPASS